MHSKGQSQKIIISEIEPINVLQVAEMMGKFGFITQKIPVDRDGFVNLEILKKRSTVTPHLSAFTA